ncbi:MAG: hypothetical protein E6H63_03365 [Betaproteobacteria bacterium]|nr:MAG: hypothetical protein E6H63_03365 [Betaproteobacteria bacterium]
MDIVDLVQWPAMLATVAAAWLVASRGSRRRWVLWGLHDHAYALVGLQFCLAAINIRGVYKND